MTTLNECEKAGPIAAGSGFANVTKRVGVATPSQYPKKVQGCKSNVRAFEATAGTFLIGSRQDSRTLLALISAGSAGITALEMSSWAYRLGAYVHRLRHYYGLIIETRREPHEGGWHARYVLKTPCRIIESEPAEGGGACG